MGKKSKYNLSISISGKNTLIIFDANAWLDLYFIPPVALEEVVNAIKEYNDIFWIPNQVYREYSRHANMKKEEIEKIFSNAKSESLSALSIFKDVALQKLTTLRNNSYLTDDVLKNKLEEKLDNLREFIKQEYTLLEVEYEKEIKVIKGDDIVNKLVDLIYDLGKEEDFSIIEKMQICEEGEIRYKYKISPGFTDDSKPNNAEDYFRKYGDLIIWKEILRKVEGKTINTIFVQNEKKQDWLAERGGTKLAKVLLEEYTEATEGKGIIEVCNFEGFIENYGDILGLHASTTAELVNILRFEREVYEYVSNDKNHIAYKGIKDYFDDMDYLYDIVSVFGCRSVYGGNFANAENTIINSISVDSCKVNYERELGIFTIESHFEIQGNADIEEYVGKDVSYIGNVDFIVSGSAVQSITIVYNNIGQLPENAYQIVRTTVDYEDLDFYNETEFEVNTYFD